MKNKTKSLGLLKINMNQTHPQSPQMLGSITLQKHHLDLLFQELKQGHSTATAKLAGWKNIDETTGQSYLTVELQPRLYRANRPDRDEADEIPNRSILDFLDEDE